jgi:hypothetical protein
MINRKLDQSRRITSTSARIDQENKGFIQPVQTHDHDTLPGQTEAKPNEQEALSQN